MTIVNQRGNVLLFVIAGIAMIASIAMGMFYMTSTSSLGQAGGSGMNRAYYLALAGKDYALANWNNMVSWNDIELSLSNTESFHLSYSGGIITSTGIVNKNTSFEAKKTIIASSPSPVRKHFLDTFENLSKWEWVAGGSGPGEVGAHEIAPVSGDNALHVLSSASAFGSYGVWSFLQLKTGTCVGCAVDFSPSWKEAGYCLSHDLQVKIANNQPYYFAGLIFKTAGVGNDREFYGVSYIRTKQKYVCYWWGCQWERDDNIPSEIKPNTGGSDGIFAEPLEYLDSTHRYSRPAIVLWKKQGSDLSWLAYQLLTSTDYVVDVNNLLVDWSNIQVRLIEAYPLGFSNGGPDPILSGAFVLGADSGASARISGTPILTSEIWSGNSAAGTLTLTNVSGTFQNGENLLVNGVIRARVSGTIGSKTNYIRVYYGDVNSHGTQNDIPTDNDNRGGSPRIVTGSTDIIHWPVDNVSDWNASNDYMTLVQWADQIGTGATRLGGSGTKEANAIIQDSSLLTPDSGMINYSGIALHATGNTATSTYFDDFAIQY